MEKRQITPALTIMAAGMIPQFQKLSDDSYNESSNYRGSGVPKTTEFMRKRKKKRNRRNSLARISKKRNR